MKLYKKDTKGKIRFLEVTTKGADLIQVSGIVGTDNPVTHVKTCKAKNVGRSNETHPDDQAISERDSLVAEKLKGGYFKSISEAENEEVVLPMLAKDYGKEVKKINWKEAVFVQPKLDGMRALGKDCLISREGTVIDTVPHLTDIIKRIPLHLDGELYAHGETFQGNMRLIKKYRPGESDKVKYNVYDIVSDEPFAVRIAKLTKAVEDYKDIHKGFVTLVPTQVITNEKELKAMHASYIKDGYEGTIVRHGDAPYKVNGRSSNLLKYKEFLDLSCEIIDIEPADQRPEWGVPVLKYKGKTFRAGMKYSHAEREEFLQNKENYIGKIAEIRFFEWTEDKLPRFPVMVGIRLDKSKGDK